MTKIGVRARSLLLVGILHGAAPASAGEHRVVTDPAQSVRPVALKMLKHLAAGELEAAAELSNAPVRRLEVLREYRDSIGEGEFKRLFGRYFAPQNRIVVEAAIGRHRLLVWDLGEAGNRLVGQYFVEVQGAFVLDDVPSAERRKLQRLLADFRSSK